MTMQQGDEITYQDETYYLPYSPFSLYLNKKYDDYEMYMISTAMIRGVFGKWVIENDKLYLTFLSGRGRTYNKEKFLAERVRLRKLMREGIITTMDLGHQLKKFQQEECWSPLILSLEAMFNTNDKVFCDWFSGSISTGYGEVLSEDVGFFYSYNNSRTFQFENGVVINITEEVNTK